MAALAIMPLMLSITLKSSEILYAETSFCKSANAINARLKLHVLCSRLSQLGHTQACWTLQAAADGGDAKIIEHHALDFPRISLANVGSGRRLLTIAMNLIAQDFRQG